MQAAGIQAVIARSYAFIYARNQANNGLLGIRLNNDEFYELAQEGVEVSVDIAKRIISCGGKEFTFDLDPIEEALLRAGGLLSVYNRYGTTLFRQLQQAAAAGSRHQSRGLSDKVGGVLNGLVRTVEVSQDW